MKCRQFIRAGGSIGLFILAGGLNVVLIQDRFVIGGIGISEVRV